MKYYEVIAKCGHVGRGRYVKGCFYEAAESAKEAAAIVRQRPRVKHDHKYAILSVTEISFEEFVDGNDKKSLNPYYLCKNVQQQKMYWEEIAPYIYDEEEREDYRKPKNKKPYKREKPLNIHNYDISYLYLNI